MGLYIIYSQILYKMMNFDNNIYAALNNPSTIIMIIEKSKLPEEFDTTR